MSALQEEVVMPHPKALIVDESKRGCRLDDNVSNAVQLENFEVCQSRSTQLRFRVN